MEGAILKIFDDLGPVGNEVFFFIITYFFNKIKLEFFSILKTVAYAPNNFAQGFKPIGGPVSGKISEYNRPLEVAKKSHMVEPTGDTELGGRWRRVDT